MGPGPYRGHDGASVVQVVSGERGRGQDVDVRIGQDPVLLAVDREVVQARDDRMVRVLGRQLVGVVQEAGSSGD
jgi:hypothetical protein